MGCPGGVCLRGECEPMVTDQGGGADSADAVYTKSPSALSFPSAALAET
jgi:hypothetical protein